MSASRPRRRAAAKVAEDIKKYTALQKEYKKKMAEYLAARKANPTRSFPKPIAPIIPNEYKGLFSDDDSDESDDEEFEKEASESDDDIDSEDDETDTESATLIKKAAPSAKRAKVQE